MGQILLFVDNTSNSCPPSFLLQARNQQKAMLLLNRFYDMQQGKGEFRQKAKRPHLATDCDDVKRAERWRVQVIREISRKVSQIQNREHLSSASNSLPILV
jgi:hypothetical protein